MMAESTKRSSRGAEAAGAGGELVGKHGDGAVGEVDGGAAFAGLGIEGGAGEDVVGDVGDVDLELGVSVREGADEDGVVEVAGGFSVNGDDGEVAEVAAGFWGNSGRDGSAIFFGGNREFSDAAGFFKDGIGEDVGEVMLADDDFDVDSEGVGGAEDFDDVAAGRAGIGREGGDLDVDGKALEVGVGGDGEGGQGFVAEGAVGRAGGGRREFAARGDEDGLGDAFVEWGDVVEAAGNLRLVVVKRASGEAGGRGRPAEE